MNSDTALKNFTRGGQTLLHSFRMIKQIVDRVILFCFLFFCCLSAGFISLLTTKYQRYLMEQVAWAEILSFFNPDAQQDFINPSGQVAHVFSKQVLNAHFIHLALKTISQIAMEAMLISLLITALSFVCLYRWLKKRGEAQAETKQLRGDEIALPCEVKKMILKKKRLSDMKIGHLPMPANFECRHIFVHGTTGSGKSVCIRELLDQIRHRGDRAIIYDKGGSYIQNYYQAGRDIILNPLDERTASWHLWDECRDSTDYDSLAAALMPMPSGTTDPFWINAARTIFAASARQMQKQADRSMINLLKFLLTADLDSIEFSLRGTEAETLVSEKNEKTAISIKSVLATYLKSLKYVKEDEKPFSIRQWVQQDENSHWLFISSLSDRHETLKPLISMWLDLAANALMSLTPSDIRRIWIILDELPTLQKLPYLPECFAESRKFGGCLVAGVQSIAQLRKIYGTNAAEEISGLCNTRLFFREPSSDTAQWVSKELGQSEVEEVKEGISYGESAMRSGISLSSQQSQRQLVSASEIMRLNDLEAYIRLPGSFPITKVTLNYKNPQHLAESFIARQIDERNFNEIDSLLNRIETQGAPDTKGLGSSPQRIAKPISNKKYQSENNPKNKIKIDKKYKRNEKNKVYPLEW
ncbi:MAG: traD [Gammaproteobacteria bacterium]|jgi:type IV conjugative transfer system coupling protein TraD|nr:traD [Gammaproteobacteria bacterium]